jgi:ADP-ribose pyrophosphatase YjhB (NUDIX family)
MKKGVYFTGITVVFMCHDGKGSYLLGKRGVNCRDEHGKWDPGGGGLEFGDTIEETLRKEIKEEYGADVLDHEFLGFREVHREHEGAKTHWIAFDFKVLVDPTQVKNGEPHKMDEIEWFTLDTFPQEVHSQLPKFLELYREKL